MTKIPIFLEQVNPLPEDIDVWAERVAEQLEAAITAIEAQDACIGEEAEPRVLLEREVLVGLGIGVDLGDQRGQPHMTDRSH